MLGRLAQCAGLSPFLHPGVACEAVKIHTIQIPAVATVHHLAGVGVVPVTGSSQAPVSVLAYADMVMTECMEA